MTRTLKKIPNSLRTYRRLAGYTQSGVMRKLNLQSTSMISRWERGLSIPSAPYLLKLSVLYRTLVNELYSQLTEGYQMELFREEPERLKENICGKFPSDRGP